MAMCNGHPPTEASKCPLGHNGQRCCNGNGRGGVSKSAVLSLDRGLPFLDFPSNYFTLGVCMCPLRP
jgi:hypothetical protein